MPASMAGVAASLASAGWHAGTAGQPRADSLGGNGQPAMTLHTLERSGVPSAVVFPIEVLTHGGPAAADRAKAIAEATPGVYTVLAPAPRPLLRVRERTDRNSLT